MAESYADMEARKKKEEAERQAWLTQNPSGPAASVGKPGGLSVLGPKSSASHLEWEAKRNQATEAQAEAAQKAKEIQERKRKEWAAKRAQRSK